jgi:uncharacterized protein YyaL (SSP411 family)
LGDDEPLYSLYYSVDAYGNWEHESNILYKTRTDAELEKLTGRPIEEIENRIRYCNEVLLEVRAKRIYPGLDDKVIISWNALMIKGYADAYKVFGDEIFLQKAITAADFIISNLWEDKTLYRIYKNGKVTIPAFSEDYAALCEALISLYEASADEHYIHKAKELLDLAIEHFYDAKKKLFYVKSNQDEQLVARKLDLNDDVIPAANSMFAKCLLLLGFLFDEAHYHEMADAMLIAVQSKIERYPTGYSNWMQVILWRQKGLNQIVISGKNREEEWKELNRYYFPNAIRLRVASSSQLPLLKDKQVSDTTKIYVCLDKVCGIPVNTVEEAMKQVRSLAG